MLLAFGECPHPIVTPYLTCIHRVTGQHATDYVHIYGLCRAGFVPELFSVHYLRPGQAVIGELLGICNGKALLYDSAFADAVGGIALPSFPLVNISSLQSLAELTPIPDVAEEDPAIIFHTSGTTGGRPKPVPQTHRWCKAHASICWPGIWQGLFDSPDVINNIGNFAHTGAASCESVVICLRVLGPADEQLLFFFRCVQVRVHRGLLRSDIAPRHQRGRIPSFGSPMRAQSSPAVLRMVVCPAQDCTPG